ncbi:hypothetical protein DFH11DRAFT_1723552 [Phellopilus nigrolimitatus]|nr:hypothetical protein DFH11DRAFT_1723552 [Phellopilus nigrolimitatus]
MPPVLQTLVQDHSRAQGQSIIQQLKTIIHEEKPLTVSFALIFVALSVLGTCVTVYIYVRRLLRALKSTSDDLDAVGARFTEQAQQQLGSLSPSRVAKREPAFCYLFPSSGPQASAALERSHSLAPRTRLGSPVPSFEISKREPAFSRLLPDTGSTALGFSNAFQALSPNRILRPCSLLSLPRTAARHARRADGLHMQRACSVPAAGQRSDAAIFYRAGWERSSVSSHVNADTRISHPVQPQNPRAVRRMPLPQERGESRLGYF